MNLVITIAFLPSNFLNNELDKLLTFLKGITDNVDRSTDIKILLLNDNDLFSEDKSIKHISFESKVQDEIAENQNINPEFLEMLYMISF